MTPLHANTGAFRGQDYSRTQEIADAAYFLDFDALRRRTSEVINWASFV
jgi:hypothetical protein